jgi:hypothetical protein
MWIYDYVAGDTNVLSVSRLGQQQQQQKNDGQKENFRHNK